MVKIPRRKDSKLVREETTESIKNIGLLGFLFMAAARKSENAISTTKAIASPTAHLPKRVFGIKSPNFYLFKYQ